MGSHSRQEIKEGAQRPIHRDYYYIDFHVTIDAIKYRVRHLSETVKNLYKPTEEKKDYFCPRCKERYSEMQVLDNFSFGTNEFHCHRCDGVLERDEVSAADRAGHERQSRLSSQLEKVLALLKDIDQEIIPKNDFQSALSRAIPVNLNDPTRPFRELRPIKPEPSSNLPGMKKETNAPLQVSVTNESASAEVERLEKVKKAAQESQNALPSWIVESAVTGSDQSRLSVKDETQSTPLISSSSNPMIKAEDEDQKSTENPNLNAEIDACFATLKAEELRAEADGASTDGSFDDGDDDFDLEDVPLGASGTVASGINTPSSSMSGRPETTNGVGLLSQVKLEREASTAPVTSNTGTPTRGESPSKKIKLSPGDVARQDDDADSDEDEEFEDAL